MKFLLFPLFIVFVSSALAQQVPKVSKSPKIDGVAEEKLWQGDDWFALDKSIIGPLPDKKDFSGRYKLRWDKNFLYLLAEIQDDVLYDAHPDPHDQYWNDDCLEIFIDEDASGGNHQFNFSAFAYHIALDNQAVDIGEKNEAGVAPFLLFNDHLKSQWRRDKNSPNKIIWEVAIKLFNKNYSPDEKGDASRVFLNKGKKIGFMLAYCDNDGSKEREHFVGSHDIEPVNGDKNRGYIDASVFGVIELVD